MDEDSCHLTAQYLHSRGADDPKRESPADRRTIESRCACRGLLGEGCPNLAELDTVILQAGGTCGRVARPDSRTRTGRPDRRIPKIRTVGDDFACGRPNRALSRAPAPNLSNPRTREGVFLRAPPFEQNGAKRKRWARTGLA